jgi:predicted PurR-regulated permease PerM
LKITTTIIIVCSVCVLGCSAVEKIQNNSNSIRSIALDSKQNFEKIHEAAVAEPPRIEEIKERSDQGISQQTAIIENAEGIIQVTPKVEDVIPWWVNFIEIVLIALAVLAGSFMLWQSGVGLLVRKMIGYVPEAKHQEAKLLDEALNDRSSMREVVAFLRAKDSDLDKAFKKRKKNAKL